MKRVVIDVDVGTDDAIAILFFLHAEKLGKVKIEAFICTNGNTSLDNVCRNLVRILESAGRTDIPVYNGSWKQLLPLTHEFHPFHGVDGFGDLKGLNEPDVSIVQKEFAASALHRLVTDNPQEISLICVGPLTNLALPMRMYKNFADDIKEIYVMGGNYYGVGNITSAAEFNFFMDPEAANLVFNCVKCPLYLLPWESCLNTKITFKWRNEILGKNGGATWKLIEAADMALNREEKTHPYWLSCDSFLALAFLYPEAILKTKQIHANVELHGMQTRGQVVLDHMKQNSNNVIIIEEIDVEFYKETLLKVCQY